jgi:hypothetical protein
MEDRNGASSCYLGEHGFEYDIFFSYPDAHVGDFEESDVKKWSLQFKQALMNRVYPRTGRLSVFSDDNRKRHNETAPLKGELKEKIKSSGLFQVVMFREYLETQYCLEELQIFADNIEQDLEWQDRIFVAEAMSTHGRQWPDALRSDQGRLTSWDFIDSTDDLPWGFQTQWAEDLPRQIAPQLKDLANKIVKALVTMSEHLARQKPENEWLDRLDQGQARRIYLHARGSDENAWKTARDMLQGLDIQVWPDRPEADDDPFGEFGESGFYREASSCDAMLIVASGTLEEDMERVGAGYRRSIAGSRKKLLPCAILDPGAAAANDDLTELAKELKTDWLDPQGVDWPTSFRGWLRKSAKDIRRDEEFDSGDHGDPEGSLQ